ncbi:hypothetical protein A1O3_10002 [Capronia epimyces CBS 606.96]|uniref:Clr5 domain-containing protein n=1 Tax=Capronia epimyces CBS 606.96 TaxID=1182542 RepID=W9XC09_9EURO|nr:uncharacterized protein A1O3_10002 [Capronia epimyces CBS 606.96]EXJ77773.1 hypothetical protein A1O3_10002 [Capronia epimyces CBS 606.96]
MDSTPSPTLETVLSLWPVVSSLSQHLPAGDLITLSRISVGLRALLHGFEKPRDCTLPTDCHFVREGLHIGKHGTLYWQRLKRRAPFECSSRTHTKGPFPKPCRYCSKPICDACIVRSSFARGHENTFQNRARYLCNRCWETGNPSQSERFVLHPPNEAPLKRKWYDPDGSTKDSCTCTLKDDGWLCLDCKDLQNWEAISSAATNCHGKDCREPLDADKERRRICLWCDKALPRQIGGTTRYHWNQKMVEARARNAASRQADLEEYNKRRLKLMRMSRREMRGDEAVKDDPDADIPQFVRHLDTLNYRSYMTESAAPSGDSIYDSKRGYWRYSREFILGMRRRCTHVPMPSQMRDFNRQDQGALTFARTNAELLEDKVSLKTMIMSISEDRVKEWCTLKTVILEAFLVQKLGYPAAQRAIQEEYGFDATVTEYHQVLRLWYPQVHTKQYRRRSLEEEDDATETPDASRNNDDEPINGLILDDNITSTTEDQQPPIFSNGPSKSADGKPSPEAGVDNDSDHGLAYDQADDDLQKLRQNAEMASGELVSSEPCRLAGNLAETTLAPSDSQVQIALDLTLDLEEEDHPGGGEVEEHRVEEDDDPPPYTPEGWIWP